MNISKNTVKSFCRRNVLGKVKKFETNPAVCEFCGKPISQPIGRKKKRFCSDTCRNSWWKSHKNLVDKKANYECECTYCGKLFVYYGNKNRKYCSHSCYIEDRFGGECCEGS